MAIAREQIIDVALQLLDQGGIENITTRRVAERLGVQQPALYWHFRSKADLLDAVNERIMLKGHTRRSPRHGESWQAFVAENARSFRGSLLAHRDGARVHAGTKPAPSDLPGAEAQLQLYLEAGFDPRTAVEASLAISRYVVGSVLEEQAEHERPISADTVSEFERYPLLRRAVETYLMGDARVQNERIFEAGLQLILAGLAMKLGKALPPRPSGPPAARQRERAMRPRRS